MYWFFWLIWVLHMLVSCEYYMYILIWCTYFKILGWPLDEESSLWKLKTERSFGQKVFIRHLAIFEAWTVFQHEQASFHLPRGTIVHPKHQCLPLNLPRRRPPRYLARRRPRLPFPWLHVKIPSNLQFQCHLWRRQGPILASRRHSLDNHRLQLHLN